MHNRRLLLALNVATPVVLVLLHALISDDGLGPPGLVFAAASSTSLAALALRRDGLAHLLGALVLVLATLVEGTQFGPIGLAGGRAVFAISAAGAASLAVLFLIELRKRNRPETGAASMATSVRESPGVPGEHSE